jgi:hypothetical protein
MIISRVEGKIDTSYGVHDLQMFLNKKYEIHDLYIQAPVISIFGYVQEDYNYWFEEDVKVFKVRILAYGRDRRYIIKMDGEMYMKTKYKSSDKPEEIKEKLVARLKWFRDQILPKVEELKKETISDFEMKFNPFDGETI